MVHRVKSSVLRKVLPRHMMNGTTMHGTAVKTESIEEEELSCIVSGCSDSESDLSFESHKQC